MINPFSVVSKYLKIFEGYLGRKIYIVFCLAVFAGLSESFGILTILPWIDQFNSNSELTQSGLISKLIVGFFDLIGINNSQSTFFIAILIGFILKALLLFSAFYISSRFRGLLIRKLKYKVYDGISNMTYEYYLKKDSGKFLNLINEQINRSGQAFNNIMLLIIKIVSGFIYLSLALIVSFGFGLSALIIGLIILTIFQKISKYIIKSTQRNIQENGNLSKKIIEILQSFKYLKATEKTTYSNKKVLKSINSISRREANINAAKGLANSVQEPILVACMLTILYVQLSVLGNPIAPSLITLALFYRALNCLIGLQRNFQNLLEYGTSLEMVDDEYKLLKKNKEITKGREISFRRNIQFENIYFSYEKKEKFVLNNINFKISSLSTIAFVGSSGAGKSTLIDLIFFVVKPQKGRILVDNQNINDIDLKKWRNQIAYVSQDTAIFDDTIFFNISLNEFNSNNNNLHKKNVIQAAKQAYIHDFIKTLPNGYNTIVGERGIKLSGGQKQRLFIARELYRKPKILILDEATSSLDTKSEKFIKESIDLLKGKMTVIIIAHRLSTIKDVDYLYVLNKGEIIEEGTYKLLKADKKSHFSKLISLQQL